LKRPNILSVVAHWASAWAMILALYFGLSAVYGYGPRHATFVAHAYAGLTVLGLVVIRLFLRTLLPWPEDESGGSRGCASSAISGEPKVAILKVDLT